jgi:trimeric autotransporter adhesin
VQIWQLSAQRDLPASLQGVVTYRGTKGTRGVQEFLPNTCPPSSVPSTCTSAPTGYVFRTSNGNSTREEGIATIRRRLRSGFTANLTYTFSKSIDDDYSFGGGTGTGVNPQVAQDWPHPERQRGLSTFDQRHLLAVQVQYTTGMGIGGRSLLSGWRGALYKEWTLLTNITTGSGLPETPLVPIAVPGTGYSNIIRAHYTGAPIYAGSPGRFLNPLAYTSPLDGQWGDARRDSIIGPAQFSLNASMDRTFRLHDRLNLETRLDATNTLNHVVYSSYITTVGNSQFGAPAGTQSMRTIQLTMRLRY